MSADKHRARFRRLRVLQDLAAYGGVRVVNHCGGIPLGAELVGLINDGLVELKRRPSGSVFGPHIRRTLACITPKGRTALDSGEA